MQDRKMNKNPFFTIEIIVYGKFNVKTRSHVSDEYKAMRCSMPKAKQFPSTRTVTASRIELCSRYAFPSLFLLFQLVYWGYYGFLREVSSEQSEPT